MESAICDNSEDLNYISGQASYHYLWSSVALLGVSMKCYCAIVVEELELLSPQVELNKYELLQKSNKSPKVYCLVLRLWLWLTPSLSWRSEGLHKGFTCLSSFLLFTSLYLVTRHRFVLLDLFTLQSCTIDKIRWSNYLFTLYYRSATLSFLKH